jgi:choline dehydrogenase-like flavoprotein
MVCERFFARDFTPRQDFPNPGDSTVPDAWPVTYDQMRPWYAAAEKLLGSAASPIRCARRGPTPICLRCRRFQ